MNSDLEARVANGHAHPRVPIWRSRSSLALCGILAIGAVMLLTGHENHLLGALPFLLVLGCPLMHLFMHHGHGEHSEMDKHRGSP